MTSTAFAWLIETDSNSVINYFQPRSRTGWTTSANEAIRFARKKDAEDFIYAYCLDDEVKVRVVEHGWG